MIQLTSMGSYHTDRGEVFAVENPWECGDFGHLQAQDVEIDGVVRHVVGVEFFAHAPPWKRGEGLGLLVRKDL